MSDSARIGSIEAFKALRPAVMKFSGETMAAVMTANAATTTIVSWLRQDRQPYWKREIRKRRELLTRANTRMISRAGGMDGTDRRVKVEDQLQVDKAKRALAEAEDKARETSRWIRIMDKAVEDCRGRLMPLSFFVQSDLARAVGSLDKMADALDAYTTLKMKNTQPAPPPADAAPSGPSEGDTP